jgi:HSP20 family protein
VVERERGGRRGGHAGILTVSGERNEEREEKHEGYYSRERVVGSFARSSTLSKGIG